MPSLCFRVCEQCGLNQPKWNCNKIPPCKEKHIFANQLALTPHIIIENRFEVTNNYNLINLFNNFSKGKVLIREKFHYAMVKKSDHYRLPDNLEELVHANFIKFYCGGEHASATIFQSDKVSY